MLAKINPTKKDLRYLIIENLRIFSCFRQNHEYMCPGKCSFYVARVHFDKYKRKNRKLTELTIFKVAKNKYIFITITLK